MRFKYKGKYVGIWKEPNGKMIRSFFPESTWSGDASDLVDEASPSKNPVLIFYDLKFN